MHDRLLILLPLLLSCGGKGTDSHAPSAPFDEACADTNPDGMLLWGDYMHTPIPFDAGAYGSILTTKDAFAYARARLFISR